MVSNGVHILTMQLFSLIPFHVQKTMTRNFSTMDHGQQTFNYKEFNEIDENADLVESYIRRLLDKYYPIAEINTTNSELKKLANLHIHYVISTLMIKMQPPQ